MTTETRSGGGPTSHKAGLDGWFEGAVHVQPVRVYYEDTDAAGVVYHADYLRYFERGRTNYLRCLGVGHRELAHAPTPLFFVVAAMTLAFLKPARLDDELRVETRFDRVRGASLEGGQALFRDGVLLVKAEIRVACVDGEGRPHRLPPTLRSRLIDHLGQERRDGPAGAASIST